jgi:peroxiredoxin
MPALQAGTAAPDFTLKSFHGQEFSLRDALERGPVALGFFKISCPVCQFAFPYLERVHKAYAGKNVTIVGVSQDDKAATAAFARDYGLSFPLLLDDTRVYPVSNAYGITNVPTVFYIDPDGQIRLSSVGWMRSEIDELNSLVADAAGASQVPVFRPNENVPEFKAG